MADGIKQGSRVRLRVDEDAVTDGQPPPPPGVWMALAHSPTGPSWWWLHPYDEVARAWASTHRGDLTTGCIERPTAQFDPINSIRL